ncbi:MAG: hypothetical protein ACP5N3_01365 [Candidatus Nanoarchaeia archaeon]
MSKGQAAIEHLSTYGWALMVLVVIIGALYLYFDSRPDKIIPDTCTFSESLQCKDFSVSEQGEINLSLRNLVGNDIRLNSTICKHESERVVAPIDLIVPAGGEFNVACNVTSLANNKVKIDVTVIYFKQGFSFPSSADGILIARVG